MQDEQSGAAASNGGQPDQPQVAVQKIYVKDASIEVPNGPQVFMQEPKPEVSVDLNTQVQEVAEGLYQLLLTVTVTATQDDKTSYLVEVQQAGVMQVSGFEEAQKAHILGAYCPSVLFPYVREAVSDMIQRAGFPPFLLQPVNFDALFMEQQQRNARAGESAATEH